MYAHSGSRIHPSTCYTPTDLLSALNSMGKQISYRFTLHFCTTFLFLFFIRFHSIHVYSFVLLSYINIYTQIYKFALCYSIEKPSIFSAFPSFIYLFNQKVNLRHYCQKIQHFKLVEEKPLPIYKGICI